MKRYPTGADVRARRPPRPDPIDRWLVLVPTICLLVLLLLILAGVRT